jgi:hypothetical protein
LSGVHSSYAVSVQAGSVLEVVAFSSARSIVDRDS